MENNINYKKLIKITNEMKKEAVELGKKEGIYWNESFWATSICSDNFETYEEARKDLLDKLSKYKSVKIINGKRGVKLIEVDSGWKLYRYTINAHNASEIIGYEDDVNLFTGKPYKQAIYKHIVYARLHYVETYCKRDSDYDLSKCSKYAEYEDMLYAYGIGSAVGYSKECYARHGWIWDEAKNDYYSENAGVYLQEYLKNSTEVL